MDKENYITKGKCIGKCCDGFIMPGLVHERRNLILAKTKRGLSGLNLNDLEYVFDMIEIKNIQHRKRKKDGKMSGLIYRYTCKHYNKETMKCNEYKKRPSMCKTFPANDPGGNCRFKGCDFVAQEKDCSGSIKTSRRKSIPQVAG